MKQILMTGLIILTGLAAHANETLKVAEDTTVSVGLIDDFKSVGVGDKTGEINLIARLTMVYVGTAAGYDAVKLNLVDNGPSEGDYGNTYVYDLGLITGTVSNLKLQRTSIPKQYILSYKASTQKMTNDGDFKEEDASKKIKITLAANGLLKSVEIIK